MFRIKLHERMASALLPASVKDKGGAGAKRRNVQGPSGLGELGVDEFCLAPLGEGMFFDN